MVAAAVFVDSDDDDANDDDGDDDGCDFRWCSGLKTEIEMTSWPLSILCRCCFDSADVAADADVDAAVVEICIAAAISFASRSKSSMLLGT